MEDNQEFDIEEINFCLPVRVKTKKQTYIIFYDGLKNQIYTQTDMPNQLIDNLKIILKPPQDEIEIPELPDAQLFDDFMNQMEKHNDSRTI